MFEKYYCRVRVWYANATKIYKAVVSFGIPTDPASSPFDDEVFWGREGCGGRGV